MARRSVASGMASGADVKVFNLRCDQDHRFEGWFGSDADRQHQLSQGLLTCPLCSSAQVTLLPSAPHVMLQRGAEPEPAVGAPSPTPVSRPNPPDAQAAVTLQAAWIQAVQHVMAHTDDVGDQFAEEARRIHYGEAESRGIRGQASLEETRDLLDEGIDVVPLPLPAALKGPLQ
jgi:hypothetical protein